MFWYNCLYCAISWDYARLIYLLLNSLNELKEIFNKTKVEEKQELIHMMNIVGNQIIHEAADHYGWKDGSTEKLLLHGAIGALTGTMSGGNALSGAVSGSVNEFALAYIEKTKGRNWMDTHPDTVQAISTALGAVAGSLTGDRNTGAYTAQMGTRWNRLAKKPQEDLNKQLKQELSTEKKNPDELLKLLTEYINMSEAAMTGGSGHTGAYISQMGTKWNLILENIPSFRESLNDDTTVNNLPVGYGQILTISGGKYGVSAGESVFVFHADGGNPVLVSTNVNVGIGMSFPMSGEVGRVWLTDSYGNLVIDPKVIMRELSGGALDWSITAGMKYNKSTTANGYILHIESMAPEISVQGGGSYTRFVGYQGQI